MPMIIVTIVILSIWLVYPAYSNGIDGVKEKSAQLKSEQAKLGDLQKKTLNIDALSGHLDSLSSEKEVLYNFIPETAKEEQIFDNFNFYAYSFELAVYGVTINQPERNVLRGDLEAEPALLPKAKNFKTEANLAGSYEKIKEFLDAIEKLNRHNDFADLRIVKNFSQGSQDVSGNFLLANIVVNFQSLDKARLSSNNMGNVAFSKNQMDTEVISEIRNRTKTSAFELNVDQKGKSNPFAL